MAETTDDEHALIRDNDHDDDALGMPLPSRKRHRVMCGVKCDGFAAIVFGMSVFAAVVTMALVVSIIVHKKKPEATNSDSVVLAVSSDSVTCADIGMNILKQNGSVVDAAIGALFCLGVVHPHSSGIGGGGFMLVKNSTGAEVIDFREVAPAGADVNMYHGNATKMIFGGLAVGVPGEVRGLHVAHKHHGNLPWQDLVMPSVNLSRHGFRAEKTLIKAITFSMGYVSAFKGLALLFKDLMPNGKVPVENQILTRPALADTLEKIASSPDAFYEGDIADGIVRAVTESGGIMNSADLKDFQPTIKVPVDVTLSMGAVKGWRILGAPPPSSGAVLALIAGIMDGYDQVDDSVLSYHRMVEAFKFAYGQRSYLGDPGFKYSSNVSKIAAQMADRHFADHLRGKINDSRVFDVSYYGGHFDMEETPGTTHLSVLRGNEAVAVTSTINTYFGSLVVTDQGVVLNNEMNDFSAPNITNVFGVPPSPPNYVEARKKPLSSTSPTIVLDDQNKVRAVLGASGGTKITSVTYQVLANMILKGKTVEQAILQPRVHHQLRPYFVMAETNISSSLVSGLRQKGNIVNNTYSALAVSQAILRAADGSVTAHSDVTRKGGAGEVATLPSQRY